MDKTKQKEHQARFTEEKGIFSNLKIGKNLVV
jgi:hypothetical protein